MAEITRYVAEDVPWYRVDRSQKSPWRDEDLAMSAPRKLGECDTEDEARGVLSDYLLTCARMGHISREGERPMLQAAAMAVLLGVEVRVHGRFYRVREVTVRV